MADLEVTIDDDETLEATIETSSSSSDGASLDDFLALVMQEQAYTTISAGETIVNGYEITLPLKYQVGNNSLELFWNGVALICKTDDNDDGHYTEVGESGEESTTIAMYRTDDDGDYELTEDVVLKVVIHGVNQEEE